MKHTHRIEPATFELIANRHRHPKAPLPHGALWDAADPRPGMPIPAWSAEFDSALREGGTIRVLMSGLVRYTLAMVDQYLSHPDPKAQVELWAWDREELAYVRDGLLADRSVIAAPMDEWQLTEDQMARLAAGQSLRLPDTVRSIENMGGYEDAVFVRTLSDFEPLGGSALLEESCYPQGGWGDDRRKRVLVRGV